MSHTCHATGCGARVPPTMWGCRRHWFMVPRPIRDRIWATYREGQCDDKRPSRAYCEAARDAVVAVAAKEGIEPDTQLYDFFLERSGDVVVDAVVGPVIFAHVGGARHNGGMSDTPLRSRSEAKKAAAAKSSTRVDESEPERRDETPPPADAEPKKTHYDFPNANKARDHALRPDLERITEEVFVRDLHAEWKELERGLTVGEKRSEHAHSIAELDKAAHRAYRAHRLYLTARAAREEWELDNEVTFGAMISEATRSLQAEKDSGTRSKQITDADVRARVATLFPDEWRAQERKRRNVELTVKSLERLAELWAGKTRDLQAMVGKLR